MTGLDEFLANCAYNCDTSYVTDVRYTNVYLFIVMVMVVDWMMLTHVASLINV